MIPSQCVIRKAGLRYDIHLWARAEGGILHMI